MQKWFDGPGAVENPNVEKAWVSPTLQFACS